MCKEIPSVENNESLGSLTIGRKEHGYAGIYGIAINSTGKLTITESFNHLPITETTKIIENPPVKGALSSPAKVFFDPSLACVLNCSFCLAGVETVKKQKQKLPSLSREQTNQINQQLVDMGVLQVKFGGGEPFIYPYFWESIDQLGKAGIALSTSTSGLTLNDSRLLSEKRVDLLKRRNVKISISIDGEPSYHDRVRRGKGLIENALEGRKRLIGLGYDPQKIEFRTTITNSSDSMSQLEYLNQLSLDLRTAIRIRVAKPTGSATTNNVAVIYPSKEFWDFFELMRRFAAKNSLFNLDELTSFDKQSALQTALDCGAGTRSAFVDANGNFMPCGFIDEHFPVPFHNIFESNESLLKLWQTGQAFVDVRNYIEEENNGSSCAPCEFVDNCQGGCPSVRLTTNTDTDPRCPVEKRVFLPVKVNSQNGESLLYSGLSTGSILHYQSEGDRKEYLVLTGEIKNGTLIVATPGGKMNYNVDVSLLDTSRREILEEINIPEKELKSIRPEKTQQVLISQGHNLETFNPEGIEQFIVADHEPKALILNIPKDDYPPALIAVFEYSVTQKPVATPEAPFVFLIPKDRMANVSQTKNLKELAGLGDFDSTEEISDDLPIKFVGTAAALIDKKIFY